MSLQIYLTYEVLAYTTGDALRYIEEDPKQDMPDITGRKHLFYWVALLFIVMMQALDIYQHCQCIICCLMETRDRSQLRKLQWWSLAFLILV